MQPNIYINTHTHTESSRGRLPAWAGGRAGTPAFSVTWAGFSTALSLRFLVYKAEVTVMIPPHRLSWGINKSVYVKPLTVYVKVNNVNLFSVKPLLYTNYKFHRINSTVLYALHSDGFYSSFPFFLNVSKNPLN